MVLFHVVYCATAWKESIDCANRNARLPSLERKIKLLYPRLFRTDAQTCIQHRVAATLLR